MKASCLHYHRVEAYLFHVESKSKPILVEQVVEESPVVSGFDICGTDPETEIVNEGKPRFMH